METARIDINYRPFRVGWAIHSGDFDAFRRAVKYNSALWGGRYNPILFIDREEETSMLVNLFKPDAIISIYKEKDKYTEKYNYLANPLWGENIFVKGSGQPGDRSFSHLLDIINLLENRWNKPEWKVIKEKGVCLPRWEKTDSLADVFLSQFGDYPDVEEVGTDYRTILLDATEGKEKYWAPSDAIPEDMIIHPNISFFTKYGLEEKYRIFPCCNNYGYYLGNVSNLDDLVTFWNLRACSIYLFFVDPNYIERYKNILPAIEKSMCESVKRFFRPSDRRLFIWTLNVPKEDCLKCFSDQGLHYQPISKFTWNGENVVVPSMLLGKASSLGIVSDKYQTPQLSFSLTERPYCSESFFYNQNLIISINVMGLYKEQGYTWSLPYIPEKNVDFSIAMNSLHEKLRIEPDRIGILIDANDDQITISAVSKSFIISKVFELAGYKTTLSPAGLLTKQLLTQLKNPQGARAFKIFGVRQLIKEHGPSQHFSYNTAIKTIPQKDTNNFAMNFKEHADLYLRPRTKGVSLCPQEVLSYLVEMGLYRIGKELKCPICRLTSWISLDILRQEVCCEMCGNKYDATPQLVRNGEWHYRRSGIMGKEKNVHGSIPVLLTMQQLHTCLNRMPDENIYIPSTELELKNSEKTEKCEVDFIWFIAKADYFKSCIILAECKDQEEIDKNDVENLKKVAMNFPENRFKVFILLSKLSSFTKDEIILAQNLNKEMENRVILLNTRELEPYDIYERTTSETGITGHSFNPEEMAKVTRLTYLK